MTLKLKTPTKRQPPDSLLGFGSVGKADARELLAIEVAARDAQWLELVGPVVEALQEVKRLHKRYCDRVCASESWAAEIERKVESTLRAITEEQE